ncbi:MAG: hypothetical protein AAF004_05840 [Pseudomonadota bacterium]
MKHCLSLLTIICAFAALSACRTTSQDTVSASYNDIVRIASGVATRTIPAPIADGARWSAYQHNNVPATSCHDMAVAPDGVNRFMVYIDSLIDDETRLYLRVGLGNNVWSSQAVSIVIPDFTDVSCGAPRITYIGDGRYVIIWINDGDLHTALYDNNQNPGYQFTLGEIVAGQFQDIGINSVTVGVKDAEPHVLWASADRSRMVTKRGRINGDVISFDQSSRFISLQTEFNSDAVMYNDELIVAVSTGSEIHLLTTGNATQTLQILQSCDSNLRLISGLLYTDPNGVQKVSVRNADIFNAPLRLLSFGSCSLENFPVPIQSGRIEYWSR